MAVRLQMKLGLVPEADRLPDSPDQMVAVEPSVGSVARTKGSLYLLVTARGTGPRFTETAKLAADTIRAEYYYDESAGIRVCMRKAVQAANKKLAHQRSQLGMTNGETDGPIGIGLAVANTRPGQSHLTLPRYRCQVSLDCAAYGPPPAPCQ